MRAHAAGLAAARAAGCDAAGDAERYFVARDGIRATAAA
jgi:hypothetical protein